MIDDYRFGRMEVEGQKIQSDLKILQGRVISGWRRSRGHHVDVEDMDDILEARPKVLVIGQGESGNMQVGESLRKALEEAGIELIAQPTKQAADTFNRLHKEGRDVAGAFHLTC